MHTFTIPVRWSDMDAYQHVNNIIYLQWLESARINLAEQLLYDQHATFVLAHVSIHYRKPVVYPDTIQLETTVSKVGNTSATFQTNLISMLHNTTVADAESVVVLFNFDTQKPKPWSEQDRKNLMAIQQPA
jgi:acyl-CoA thioester hydrolase